MGVVRVSSIVPAIVVIVAARADLGLLASDLSSITVGPVLDMGASIKTPPLKRPA